MNILIYIFKYRLLGSVNYFSFSLFIGGVIALVSGLMVYRRRTLLSNKLWFWLNICTAIWSFGYATMISATTYRVAWISNLILHYAAIFIPILYLYFILSFTKSLKQNKKKLIKIFLIGLFFITINHTSFFIRTVKQKFIFNYAPDAGPLYVFFALYFWLLVVWATVIILKTIIQKKEQSIAKQAKYILLSEIGFLGGGSVFFLTFNINIPPYPIILFSLYPIVIVYAIIKHRLMDVRVVITRSLIFSLLVLGTSVIFGGGVFLMGKLFGDRTQVSNVIMSILASAVIVVLMDPLKQKLAAITDHIFFKKEVNYDALLGHLSKIIAQELDIKKLTQFVAKELEVSLKITRVSFFLLGKDQTKIVSMNKGGKAQIVPSASIFSFIKRTKQLFITEELVRIAQDTQDQQEKQALNTLLEDLDERGIAAVIPIILQDEVSGLLVLGAKVSGDIFNMQEIRMFEVLSSQLGAAVAKARLYEEVSLFNVALQKKVKGAMKELQMKNREFEEHNQYLTILQTIGDKIAKSLDVLDVAQIVADSIALELGYVGGIVMRKEDEARAQIIAMSNTPILKATLEQLLKETHHFTLPFAQNELGRVLHDGERLMITKLAAMMSPPLLAPEVEQLQAELHIKTAVAVPIRSEGNIEGCIVFMSKKEEKFITPAELDMMESLTAEVGAIFGNLFLYRQLEATHQDLNNANQRLFDIDKTKSEFLSIAAHQLRTPLSGIKGYLSMLLEGDFGKLLDNQRAMIKELFVNANRLTRLVNNFLDVSRIDANRLKIEKKWFDLRDILDAIYMEFATVVKEKHLEFMYKRNLSAGKVMVYGDMDKIHDALINIVDNCIKYTNTGGVGVSLQDSADAIVITIHDTGVGIDPNELATLFDKFVRGRERGGKASGAGFGLYIAKKVIEAHGGKIKVESEGAGKGSTFEVTILKKSFQEDVGDVVLHPEISPPRALVPGVTPQAA